MQANPKPRYIASRGGHAPGHLRSWFEESFFGCQLPEEMEEQGLTLHWLTGQLWNCSDTMPSSLCADLELPRGSTYAAGARALRARSRRQTN